MIKRITIEENEEYLRQVSTEIDFEKDDYKKYIADLKEYCTNNVVYAMAPVQIGIPKRIIYIRNTSSDMTKNSDNNYNEDIVYINPVIKKMKGHTRFLEGCESCKLSTGEFVTGVIDRPYQIEIEYYDINKEKHFKTIEGFETTIFCHEFDHLNGILHMDRTNETYLMTLEQMREYRNKNPYEIISKEEDFSYKKTVSK
jgi:peptide deformylase